MGVGVPGQPAPKHPILSKLESAIYGCGYSTWGCNLRLSQVRSGSFGVDLWPVWGPNGPPTRSKLDPTRTSDNLKLQPYEL